MDMLSIVNNVGQWGIAGLFFVMWYFERKDRLATQTANIDLGKYAQSLSEQNLTLIKLVQQNTEAYMSLKGELSKLSNVIDRKLDAK